MSYLFQKKNSGESIFMRKLHMVNVSRQAYIIKSRVLERKTWWDTEMEIKV